MGNYIADDRFYEEDFRRVREMSDEEFEKYKKELIEKENKNNLA